VHMPESRLAPRARQACSQQACQAAPGKPASSTSAYHTGSTHAAVEQWLGGWRAYEVMSRLLRHEESRKPCSLPSRAASESTPPLISEYFFCVSLTN
jgi:hypothetical protein